jgi:hypothetical protein
MVGLWYTGCIKENLPKRLLLGLGLLVIRKTQLEGDGHLLPVSTLDVVLF